MNPSPRAFVALLAITVVSIGPSFSAVAQQTQAPVRHLRGVIDVDQTWSGLIVVTDDLVIQDATVTIEAGTTVEFACKSSGRHPTLTVGAVDRSGGHLELLGTAQKPITFRTRPDTNPGRLVINVRRRGVPTQRTESHPLDLTRAEYAPRDVVWQHVRFENLGHLRTRRKGARSARLAEPAVFFNVIGAAHTLGVVSCILVDTTRLRVRAADGARISLLSNRVERPKERVGIEVSGHEGAAPAGPIAISQNRLAAAIHLHSASAAMTGNILIGPDAAIVIEHDASSETRLIGNYVHNTTTEDEGRYCLKCDNPDALIRDNVFRGGTTCVWNGSRRMSGNVLIAAPRLTGQVVKNARTHELIHALPRGAVFERNLLLGPAYTLMIPHPLPSQNPRKDAPGPTHIRHNLFDGFSNSNRAIGLNPAGREALTVIVSNNVFLRIPTLVCDEAGTGTTLTYADHNAVAPLATRAFERVRIEGITPGDPGWGANDVNRHDVALLHLAAPLRGRVPDYDADLQARQIGVNQIRQQLFNAYRPLPDSPLVGAGYAHNSPDAGVSPSIGPSEPTEP